MKPWRVQTFWRPFHEADLASSVGHQRPQTRCERSATSLGENAILNWSGIILLIFNYY